MKKVTYATGLVSALLLLTGVIFKFYHWSGAGVLLTLGAFTFATVYNGLLLVDKNRIAAGMYQKFVNYSVALAMLIITAGFLFKVQHWPGAGIGVIAGHIILLLLIPICLVQTAKESDPVKKLHFGNITVFLIVLLSFSFFIWKIIGQH